MTTPSHQTTSPSLTTWNIEHSYTLLTLATEALSEDRELTDEKISKIAGILKTKCTTSYDNEMLKSKIRKFQINYPGAFEKENCTLTRSVLSTIDSIIPRRGSSWTNEIYRFLFILTSKPVEKDLFPELSAILKSKFNVTFSNTQLASKIYFLKEKITQNKKKPLLDETRLSKALLSEDFLGEALLGEALLGEALLGEALLGEGLLSETLLDETHLYHLLILIFTQGLLVDDKELEIQTIRDLRKGLLEHCSNPSLNIKNPKLYSARVIKAQIDQLKNDYPNAFKSLDLADTEKLKSIEFDAETSPSFFSDYLLYLYNLVLKPEQPYDLKIVTLLVNARFKCKFSEEYVQAHIETIQSHLSKNP